MTEIKSLWSTTELAEFLGTSRGAVNTLRWRIAKGLAGYEQLPPCLAIGGRPRWDPEQVNEWIRDSRTPVRQATAGVRKTKVGRPRLVTDSAIRLK